MTDTELLTKIRTIIKERVRGGDRATAELGKYDRIAGLLRREGGDDETPEAPDAAAGK